ncbi:MAG: TetR family transcriptional regulator C-terminal domain-containing protein [Bacteroidota bacterium]
MGRKSIAAIRRKEILEHLFQLIYEEGFEAASTVRLARRMDMPSSLLIHYFRTKEEMIHALIEWMIEQYEQTFLPRLEAISDPGERLDQVLSTIFGSEWDDQQNGQVFYSCFPLIFHHPKIRERYQRNYTGFHAHLLHELSLAEAAHIIPPQDLGRSAHLLIALVEGFNFYERIRDDKTDYGAQGKAMKAVARLILGCKDS